MQKGVCLEGKKCSKVRHSVSNQVVYQYKWFLFSPSKQRKDSMTSLCLAYFVFDCFYNKFNLTSWKSVQGQQELLVECPSATPLALFYCKCVNLCLYDTQSHCNCAQNCPDTLEGYRSTWEWQCSVCAGEVSISVVYFYQQTDKHQGMLTLHVFFWGKKKCFLSS